MSAAPVDDPDVLEREALAESIAELRTTIRAAMERGDAGRPGVWERGTPEQRDRWVEAHLDSQLHLAGRALELGLPGLASLIAQAERNMGSAKSPAGNAGIDAADLLELELAPLRWVVPDLIPEGTTIVASPPKVGKSCFAYQASVEVAVGGELLGRRVAAGSVLYLALEDGRRRGQDRLRAALAGRTMPRGRLEVRWGARRIGEGLEDDIAAWLDAHPDAALVIIDTLGRVRPRTNGKRNAYEVDVEDLGRLQGLFRDRSVALVIVHHARKDSGGDDFLASVSGSYGITGSADTIVVIRRKRLEAFGTIVVTGRDVPDAELPVRFDGMTWSSAPLSLAEASFERIEVYRAIEERGPIFPAAVAEATGLGRTSVQNMVAKLVEGGAVVRTAKGYVAVAGLARAYTTHPDDPNDPPSHQSHGGHARTRASGGSPSDLSVGARQAAIFAANGEADATDEPSVEVVPDDVEAIAALGLVEPMELPA